MPCLKEFSEAGQSYYSLTTDGTKALLAYSWPGNIRELRSVIQRIVVLSDKTIVDEKVIRNAIGLSENVNPPPTGNIEILGANVKREALIRALENSHGNKRLAAKSLGISDATIYRWVQDFGLGALVNNLRMGLPTQTGASP